MSASATDLSLIFTVIAASTTAFLGAIVFYHDRKSVSNSIFIIHSLVGVAWSVATYGSIVAGPESALIWIRAVIFLAVPHVFLFLLFTWNFPSVTLTIRRSWFWTIIITMLAMMYLATTSHVFQSIKEGATGIVPIPGDIIALFGPMLIVTVLITFAMVIRELRNSAGIVRLQWRVISAGLSVAYALLIFGVFVPVIGFENTKFVRYSPLFILPVFIGAAYAILRHRLFNVKVIASEALVFFLLLASVAQVVIARDGLSRAISVFVTIAVLIFGVLLMKSVLREVEQREELEILTKQLQDANGKLEELSHFKTQLLSLASHQIRAPLAAIKGYATLLLDGSFGTLGAMQVANTIEKVKKQADELISLINTLLDLRKVEEGKMEYQFAPTDFGKMVADVVDSLRSLATGKGVGLEFTPPAAPIMVSADEQKLRQVVQNLIDNAIKYTPQGKVTVQLSEPTPNLVQYSVTDTGLGFEPTLAVHLFEEFVRDERVKKQILGTGLGLFIARKIIEAHGGKIWAESSGLGKGATFSVTLKKG